MSSSASTRFSDKGEDPLSRLESLELNDKVSIDLVVAETRNELPSIRPENLRFDRAGNLGQGTSFEVRKAEFHKRGGTPYYVAVKSFRSSEGGHNLSHSKRYSGFLRELRVLMHPPLKSHGCIVQIIAHGWIKGSQDGGEIYLIMDYSDHGTLLQYLDRCNISLGERRELALDVASALKALHKSRIVHGDIKPENVLVFDNSDHQTTDPIRPQVAKLSDFSGAIFEQDFTHKREVNYLGTEKYLAPDIVGRSGNQYKQEIPTFSIFEFADIYSFGLLVWEVFKNGESYIDLSLLQPGETTGHFLDRMSDSGEDALCRIAMAYFNASEDIMENPNLSAAFKDATAMCLKDNPHNRKIMGEVIQALAQGAR